MPRGVNRPNPFGEDAQELAFAIWAFEADQTFYRVRKIWPKFYPGTPVPSADSLRNWHNQHNWPDKLREYLAQRHRDFYLRYIGKALITYSKHLEFQHALMSPDDDEVQAHWRLDEMNANELNKLRAARSRDFEILLGLGTHGVKGGQPDIPLPSAHTDPDNIFAIDDILEQQRQTREGFMLEAGEKEDEA